jgi:hypothetical protein
MRALLVAVAMLSLLVSCTGPEPQLPPETASAPGTGRLPDTALASTTQRLPDTASASEGTLPSGYTLTDTTEWSSLLEEGTRAILRRGGVAIDTVDLSFGVAAVGEDSLVFLPVRTDTVPLGTTPEPAYESFPTEHVLWTPVSRRELRNVLPFFDAYFSTPIIARKSAIHYWGIARRDSTNRLYAIRYDFPTARVDSLFLNREDPLATDYRYHLRTPQIHGNEISFGGVVLDVTTWRMIRQDPPSN